MPLTLVEFKSSDQIFLAFLIWVEYLVIISIHAFLHKGF